MAARFLVGFFERRESSMLEQHNKIFENIDLNPILYYNNS